jgi:hypothetical protein
VVSVIGVSSFALLAITSVVAVVEPGSKARLWQNNLSFFLLLFFEASQNVYQAFQSLIMPSHSQHYTIREMESS